MVTPSANIDTTLLYDALAASPIGVAVETLDGRPLYANPALCRLLGFSEEEMLRKKCVDFSPAEDAEKDWTLFQQLKSGVIDHYQIDKRYFRRDGSLVWGRLTVSLVRTVTPPLVLAMVDDISERKLMESRLQEYEKAVECAEEMIVVVDRDYRYLVANRKYLLAHCLTRDQVIGRSVYQVLSPGEFDCVKQKVDECLSGNAVSFEIRHSFPGIGERDIAVSYYPIEGKHGIDGVVGILKDITEKKRAEDALHTSEERLRLAQQSARMGTFEANLKTGEYTWTPELEAVYGLSVGGFGKTRAAFLDLVHPDDRAGINRLREQAIRSGQPIEGEWRIIRPDGSIRWVDGRWRVFMNERGEPSRILGVNVDVTERKLAEAALLQMNRKLLEAQEQERARIGRELHDDINQQLAVVAMELDSLLHSRPKTLAERAQRLDDIREQVVTISSGVQSLSHQLHPAQLEYLGIVSAMKSFCHDFCRRQSFKVDFEAQKIVHPVSPEAALCLLRVLQEALHNAAKHSQRHSFKVAVGEVGGALHLSISDNGIGFDVQAAQKSGLGLISMRERTRLVNGTIDIESRPRSGTTVHVQIPIS